MGKRKTIKKTEVHRLRVLNQHTLPSQNCFVAVVTLEALEKRASVCKSNIHLNVGQLHLMLVFLSTHNHLDYG